MERRRSPHWTVLSVAAAGIGLASCSEYMDRKDTVAFSAGEAVQTNVITQISDPWPVHARYKNIAVSGERTASAVRRYQCGPGAARIAASPSPGGNGGAAGAPPNGGC